ncbi:MAG: HD domain-containing protein [Chloroflexota bacterium]|nr:HD domain-containing protein [Chloroflexota bacterium]
MDLLPRLRAQCAAIGVDPYLVGGYVRDALMGRATRDIDLAVPDGADALAEGIARSLGGTRVELDAERGTHRVDGIRAEGASWRVDVATLQGGIEEDLRLRDFTIDAIAMPLSGTEGAVDAWPLVDPAGGLADLRAGVVRVTAAGVLADDPLRLLRAVRIAAQTGFTLDAETARAVCDNASLLANVSAERVREELLTILSLPRVGHSLGLLDTLGLLDVVLPELSPSRGVKQPVEHHWDVFDHTLHCVEYAEQVLDAGFRATDPAGQLVPWPDWADDYFAEDYADGHTRATYLKLACLLHDVAKPETKSVQPNGRVRFLGHPVKGADTVRSVLRRLRASGKAQEAVAVMVEQHLRPSQLAQKGELPTARAVYRYYRDLQDVAVDTLYLSMADYLAARGPELELDNWAAHCDRVRYTLDEGRAQKAPERRERLLTGHDLMTLFNLSSGPELRPLLEMVQESGAAGEVKTREEAVTLVSHVLGRAPATVEARHGQ